MRLRRTVASLVALLVLVPSGRAAGQEFWIPAKLDSLRAAARADSNDAGRHHAVALALWNRKKLGDAERAFREALAAEPRYAPAHLGLAILAAERRPDLFRPKGKKPPPPAMTAARDSVIAQYRHAFLLDPLVKLELPGAPVDSSRLRYRPSDVRWAAESALWAFLGGAFVRAYLLSQWVVEQHESFQVHGPIPPEVLWVHALSAARLGWFEPGIRDLTLLVDRSQRAEEADTTGLPTFLYTNDLRYMLAYLRSKAGHAWSAVDTYRQVLVYDLGYWMAHVRLADLLEGLKRWDEAVQEREQAVLLNPEDPTLLADLGVTLGRAGKLAASDSILALAQVRMPRDPSIPYYRGELAWVRNDPPGARAAYEAFLALAPLKLAAAIADIRIKLEALPVP